MPLDLGRVEQFARRLTIRDRDTGLRVPFVLRPQQQYIFEQFSEHLRRKRRLFGIFLKGRRLGISTLANLIQVAHCVSVNDAHASIIAQGATTAKEIWSQASSFGRDLRSIIPGITDLNQTVKFPHHEHPSELRWNTAGSVAGTRGLTFSSAHLTEAAFYPYGGIFTAVMNTISKDPNNVCLIETTANGMEGPGAAYYDYWQAAMAGDSEFLPIFLPWWEDPEYVRDPAEAADAPRNDYEKWLMNDVRDPRTGKKVEIGKDRIAWFRRTLIDKCESNLDRWRAEFPATPEEAFVATGSPAFSMEEITFAKATVQEPLHGGEIFTNSITMKKEFRAFEVMPETMLRLFELPQRDACYFQGVDTAKGSSSNPGDFAASVGWNGETGEMAWRFAARVTPERLAGIVDDVGRFFNNAYTSVEENNLGYVVIKELRDVLFYPNQAKWLGRDDKAVKPSLDKVNSLGFTTSTRSRQMIFNNFRADLYRNLVKPKDHMFVTQMVAARQEMGFRWEITQGHDDVFMAGLIGWHARNQIHPEPCYRMRSKHTLVTPEEFEGMEITAGSLQWTMDRTTTQFGALMQNANDHLRKLQRYNESKDKGRRNLLWGL